VAGATALLVVAGTGTFGMRLLTQVRTRVQLMGLKGADSFEGMGFALFGVPGHRVVQASVFFLQFGVCAVNLSLLTTNAHAGLLTLNHDAPPRDLVLLPVAAVCAAISMVPDLSALAACSLLGNLAMLVVVASTLAAASAELATGGNATLAPPFPQRLAPPATLNLTALVRTVTTLFCACPSPQLVPR
jgi:amino acid permease